MLKTKGYFFLILFIAFLATPSVITLIQPDQNLYSTSFFEEENTQDSVEIEKNHKISHESFGITFFEIIEENSGNFSYTQRLSSIYLDPAIPPPRVA